MSKICKRGHASSALPSGRGKDGKCKECKRKNRQNQRARRGDEIRAKSRAWSAANPEKVRAMNAAQYVVNSEKRRAYSRAWTAANPEKARAQRQKWAKENHARKLTLNAARKAKKRQQACTCCTTQQLAGFYGWARKLGCEVDHKQALALGGLHCLKNLEALTPAEHKRKTAEWDIPLIAVARRSTTEETAQQLPALIQSL